MNSLFIWLDSRVAIWGFVVNEEETARDEMTRLNHHPQNFVNDNSKNTCTEDVP